MPEALVGTILEIESNLLGLDTRGHGQCAQGGENGSLLHIATSLLVVGYWFPTSVRRPPSC